MGGPLDGNLVPKSDRHLRRCRRFSLQRQDLLRGMRPRLLRRSASHQDDNGIMAYI